MKSKDAGVAGGEQQHRLVPRLRFPEFSDAGEWQKGPLRDFATIINDRVGDQSCTPYSITSGVGLVTQKEKFGRTIAGKQLKNYVVLRHGDFAYNKSATKESPQGFIATYSGHEPAAVPNSIFTCFRVQESKLSSSYLSHLFGRNLHGKWLSKYMTVGARAHGSLNIDDEDLLSLPVPQPVGRLALAEQKKIADCLSSIDELIAAEARKLGALKVYKKGLMQQLFPAEGETIPSLRFPEFREAGKWESRTIGDSCEAFSGGTPSTLNKRFYGGIIPFIRSAEIASDRTELFLTNEGIKTSAAKMVRKGDILVALYGANSGDVAIAKIDGAINQAILCLRHGGNNVFVYQSLAHKQSWIVSTYIQGGQGNLSGEIVQSIKLYFPDSSEQQRIADCLSSTDEFIAAQSRRINTLRAHKKSLMQQLFPVLDEVHG